MKIDYTSSIKVSASKDALQKFLSQPLVYVIAIYLFSPGPHHINSQNEVIASGSRCCRKQWLYLNCSFWIPYVFLSVGGQACVGIKTCPLN